MRSLLVDTAEVTSADGDNAGRFRISLPFSASCGLHSLRSVEAL